MHATVFPTKRVTLALIAALLGGCEYPETDQGGAVESSPPAPATGTLSTICSNSPPLPGATMQAVGAFCVGLALVGGDALGCVPTALVNVTQCVDYASGTDYAVQWDRGVGTVFADQATLGLVEQRSTSSFDVALYDGQTRAIEPAGECRLINTTLGQQAQFCAYLR